jgi:hypothetical protein
VPQNFTTGRVKFIDSAVIAEDLRLMSSYQQVVGGRPGQRILWLDEAADVGSVRNDSRENQQKVQYTQHV